MHSTAGRGKMFRVILFSLEPRKCDIYMYARDLEDLRSLLTSREKCHVSWSVILNLPSIVVLTAVSAQACGMGKTKTQPPLSCIFDVFGTSTAFSVCVGLWVKAVPRCCQFWSWLLGPSLPRQFLFVCLGKQASVSRYC